MSTKTELRSSPLVSAYKLPVNNYDEMLSASGMVRDHWKHFIDSLNSLGAPEIERRNYEVKRLLRENGVSYNVHGDPEGQFRPWQLDPVPFVIGSDEWATIESGLIQRAELLNLVLQDLYGPRELLKQNLLPPDLVYGSKDFLSQCENVRLSGDHQLIFYSADFARGPDRQMWIISDRTEAPTGLGYTLENRNIMSRVFPSLFRDCQVHRLAGFFRMLRANLEELAANSSNQPTIVVLTSGPKSEFYFEHAFLSSYLGYPLVQGADLTVRGGSVWMKSVGGLTPVDIIFRRVSDRLCDPLELDGYSAEGVPGLLEASRRGNVTVVNPIGSSLIENPAFMAFLPRLARHYLGQDLRLPNAATWWCGHEKEKTFVLENLKDLVIRSVSRRHGNNSTFAGDLDSKSLKNLYQKILAKPTDYVAQERVTFSTLPSFVENRFEPRNAIIRSFVVARGQSYVVMPGGLTLSSPYPDNFMITYERGGISKDTWILDTEPGTEKRSESAPLLLEQSVATESALTSRTAENLYWIGRYAERGEATARLLRTIITLHNEKEDLFVQGTGPLKVLLRALTRFTGSYPGFVGAGKQERLKHPEKELIEVTMDANRNGSLAMTLNFFIRAGYSIRECWSNDTWRVVNDIEDEWSNVSDYSNASINEIQDKIDLLITALGAYSGLMMESMTRETGWIVLDIGRRLERALNLIRLIRSTVVIIHKENVEYALLESLLATSESLITYRRRYRSQLKLINVLDLLLLDPTNPRSLIYQLEQLQKHISRLPHQSHPKRLSNEDKLILRASSFLRLSELDFSIDSPKPTLYHKKVDATLSELVTMLLELSEALTQSYFVHAEIPTQLTGG